MSGAYGEAEEQKTVTFKAPEGLVDAFDDYTDESPHAHRSDALRAAMRACINGDGDDADASARIDTESYLPGEDRKRELYQACLEYSSEKFIVVENRHFGKIAEETKVKEKFLDEHLAQLEKLGYVRRLGVPPNVQDPPTRWRVKPPAADPDEWTHRRPDREEARQHAEQRLNELLAPVEADGSGEAARRDLKRMQAAADGGEGDGGSDA